jgi:hypothetical protein
MSTVRICVVVLLVFVAQFFVAEFQSGELSSHGDRSWGPFPEGSRPCVPGKALFWIHFMNFFGRYMLSLVMALVSWASRCQRQIKEYSSFLITFVNRAPCADTTAR